MARGFLDNGGDGNGDGERKGVLEEKLSKLRRKQGLSQQEVADALGVSRQTISNWESGQGAPTLEKAAELARLYHVGLDDLVADDVEVVAASIDTPPGKDLHVLRGLAGTTCKVFFSDDELMLTLGTGRPGMKVLDVSDEWVRIEYERASGVGKRQTVVQLVDVNAIESFVIAGDAS